MAGPSHLIRRGAIYYFRRKIPLHLREQVGKEEIRKSLGTSDLHEARVRAAAEAANLEQEFVRLRNERFAQRREARLSGRRGQPSVFVTDLFDKWNAGRKRPRTTVYDFAKASRRFVELNPLLPVHMIEPAHLQAFKDAVIAEGVSAGTVRKQFGALSAMLEVAVTEGVLPDNPARGLRLSNSVGEPQTRLAFSAAELRAIFSTPIYRLGERPRGGAGAAAYWLPLLALYTGARLGEIGALQVKNVREAAGIRYLDLPTEHARAQNLHRPVPLHTDLVRLGFLQFVEMQRRSGESALFEELRGDNKGKLTGNWSKWFARYLRNVAKVEDSRKSFDSFRPSFIEACERAFISTAQQAFLTGRQPNNISPGQKSRLEDLHAAVQALVFDIGDSPA